MIRVQYRRETGLQRQTVLARTIHGYWLMVGSAEERDGKSRPHPSPLRNGNIGPVWPDWYPTRAAAARWLLLDGGFAKEKPRNEELPQNLQEYSCELTAGPDDASLEEQLAEAAD